jgi:hypothetical protein
MQPRPAYIEAAPRCAALRRRVNNKGFPHNVVFDEDAIPAGTSADALSHEDYLNVRARPARTAQRHAPLRRAPAAARRASRPPRARRAARRAARRPLRADRAACFAALRRLRATRFPPSSTWRAPTATTASRTRARA